MTAKVNPFHGKSSSGQWVVRLYDGMDNQWLDVGKPMSREEALALWNEKTKNGTKNVRYSEIDYYAIFPADTRMIYSEGFGEQCLWDERPCRNDQPG